MNKKKAYSAEEKKAYYMGVGAGRTYGRAEAIGVVAKSMSPEVRKSFLNGWEKGVSQAKRK